MILKIYEPSENYLHKSNNLYITDKELLSKVIIHFFKLALQLFEKYINVCKSTLK
jgi:hypothetical protein